MVEPVVARMTVRTVGMAMSPFLVGPIITWWGWRTRRKRQEPGLYTDGISA
jgi:hypothetical protein